MATTDDGAPAPAYTKTPKYRQLTERIERTEAALVYAKLTLLAYESKHGRSQVT